MKLKMPCNTVDGVLHDLADLNPYEVSLEAIATGLANQCRYNGQVKKFYSVAEHCVLLCRFAKKATFDEQFQKQLLMHDASEAYVGDIIRGLKDKLPEFITLEDQIIKKIFTRYEIAYPLPVLLKEFDHRICKDEMKVLQKITDPELERWVNDGDELGVKIKNWTPDEAKQQFLKECKRLRIA